MNVKNNFFDPAVNDHFSTNETWGKGGVEGRLFDIHPVVGRLRDRVFLSVRTKTLIQFQSRGAEAVASGAAPLTAISHASGRSVVAGGDNPLILDDYGGDAALEAIASERHHPGDLHEIGVPGGARPGLGQSQGHFSNFFTKGLEVSAVVDLRIRQSFASDQLLGRGIAAFEFPFLVPDEFLQGSWIVFPASLPDPCKADFAGRRYEQEGEIGNFPQSLHLFGISDRIDHVIPVRFELDDRSLRQNGESLFFPESGAGLDQFFPGNLPVFFPDFLTENVGERVVFEAAFLQEFGDLSFSGTVPNSANFSHFLGIEIFFKTPIEIY